MCVVVTIYKPIAWTMANSTNSEPSGNHSDELDMKISDALSLLL